MNSCQWPFFVKCFPVSTIVQYYFYGLCDRDLAFLREAPISGRARELHQSAVGKSITS
jgi:hypothetical protein